MKKINFFTLIIAFSLLIFNSCDDDPKVDPNPEPPVPLNTHFDIWSPVGGNAGMGTLSEIVKRVTSLDEGVLEFEGTGVDVSEKLTPHVIIKGQYYYQVKKEGRFGKYQIEEDNLKVIKEIPFSKLKDRLHTHAWLDDRTLVLIGSNGPSNKILWAKIDTEAMVVLEEGELSLPIPPVGQVYNTSGMAAYRKSDNIILYSFEYKKTKKNGTEPKPEFYMSFINASDMSTIKTVTEDRAEKMASTAYGELRQEKSFFDENGDYYIACNTVLPGETNSTGGVTRTAQKGAIFRVKNGTMEFDKSYSGYNEERGKIVTMTYMNNGKAILYMQDPYHTTGTKIWDNKTNPYVFYWIVVDLKSSTYKKLDIPHGSGNFSQLAIVVGDRLYIGSNPEGDQSCFYIYNILSGQLKKGASLADGFHIDRIVWIED